MLWLQNQKYLLKSYVILHCEFSRLISSFLRWDVGKWLIQDVCSQSAFQQNLSSFRWEKTVVHTEDTDSKSSQILGERPPSTSPLTLNIAQGQLFLPTPLHGKDENSGWNAWENDRSGERKEPIYKSSQFPFLCKTVRLAAWVIVALNTRYEFISVSMRPSRLTDNLTDCLTDIYSMDRFDRKPMRRHP